MVIETTPLKMVAKTVILCLLLMLAHSHSFDITHQVFGSLTDGVPSAFGDFNSDEITDLFVTRNQGSRIEILLGSYETEPFLKPANLFCEFNSSVITSVVPGDFNGDAFMDVLVTVHFEQKSDLYVHILYGGLTSLNCSYEERKPVIKLSSEPLAIDYNNDFITDLFAVDDRDKVYIWVFTNDTNKKPNKIMFHENYNHTMRKPHSNAFLDLNNDDIADIFITNKNNFEIWGRKNLNEPFNLTSVVELPVKNYYRMGQSLFIDVESKGVLNNVLPVLMSETESRLYVYRGEWIDLHVNFRDSVGTPYSFYPKDPQDQPFTKTVTLREGDYNMDGYPDLIATLMCPTSEPRAYLLENVPCTGCNFSRTFKIHWDGFMPSSNSSVLGVFFDIYQDGILDVILIKQKKDGVYNTVAYKNNLEYDANFVKVMVLTGLSNDKKSTIVSALGNRKRSFSTNLPGPRITCKILDQDGNLRVSISPQIPQSAHYSLNLPYTMFGLGRTPNFVDIIGVGFASKSKEWSQLIPNSQMVVIPDPINEPNRWKMQLFVTPSKLILNSVASLVGTCIIICIIIGILHWKERKVDRLERLQEAYRFHFDAM